MLKPALIAALILSASPLLAPSPASAAPTTWVVRAGAPAGGDGSAARPFASLDRAEAASAAGDVIRVLPGAAPLDGGITLKPRQVLEGAGPDVRSLPAGASAPWLTNTRDDRLSGDAVRLADDAVVRNLRISGTRRGAVYGEDVSGVVISGNDVSGQNGSCVRGFLIPQFNAPTNVPGVGIPIVGGLPNGWAGIMVDADSRRGGTVTIAGNRVHDAECGDGIDVRISGTASYVAEIRGNDVRRLRQGAKLLSVLAIGLQTRDTGSLVATVADNTQALLGNDDDLNLLVEGADSEGVFVNGVGPSRIEALVTGNNYTNERGWGGFSANGLEMVTMGRGTRAKVVVRDSSFSGSTGDVIEEGALGGDGTLEMVLERVVVERSVGFGNTGIVPFNNGDCVLAGSLGARNTVALTVRDSVIRNCANNGISIGADAVNPIGRTKAITLDVARTTLTGNRGGNLGVRTYTPLDSLRVKVENSDLARSSSLGSSIADAAFEDGGTTRSSVIDLGGGALGSTGGNCFRGGLLAMNVLGYQVSARGNWWSRPGGPGVGRTSVIGGSLDARQPLGTAPRWCS